MIDSSLDFTETTRPSERRREQPEESANLRIVTQVNAFSYAPGNPRIVQSGERRPNATLVANSSAACG